MRQQLWVLMPPASEEADGKELDSGVKEGDPELSQVTCWLRGGLRMEGLVVILCGRNEKAFQAGKLCPFKPAHGSQGPCETGVTWSPVLPPKLLGQTGKAAWGAAVPSLHKAMRPSGRKNEVDSGA